MSPSFSNSQKQPKAYQLHRRAYNWVLSWAFTPYGSYALAIIAFFESIIFPLPPDILLMALCISRPKKWWFYATSCTLFSVLGAVGGYYVGVFFWETLGQWIITHVVGINLVSINGRMDIPLPGYLVTHYKDVLGGEYVFQVYDKWNAWIVLLFGLTPIPYKIVTITAGVAQTQFIVFIAMSILARGLRFFTVALLLRLWGAQAKAFIEKHFDWLTFLFFVCLIGGFLILKVFF